MLKDDEKILEVRKQGGLLCSVFFVGEPRGAKKLAPSGRVGSSRWGGVPSRWQRAGRALEHTSFHNTVRTT